MLEIILFYYNKHPFSALINLYLKEIESLKQTFVTPLIKKWKEILKQKDNQINQIQVPFESKKNEYLPKNIYSISKNKIEILG